MVNALELAQAAMPIIQSYFYREVCPPIPEEKEYNYQSQSVMNVCGMRVPEGCSAAVVRLDNCIVVDSYCTRTIFVVFVRLPV
jgi:hypothetical protein